MTGSRDPRRDDERGRQRGGVGPLNPVSAVGAAFAAAWGMALGFASALLGSGRRAEERAGRPEDPGAAAGPMPERPQPEASAAEPAARPEAAAEAPAVPEPAKAEPQRPPGLDRPRGGKADDLKQIAGIGPKLEKELNKIGIHHYDQIAGWTESHVVWIDRELKTRGRVQRDDWPAQAKSLM